MEFALYTFERILKKYGAKRVSNEAAKEFAQIVEEKVFEVAKEAASLAKHAGRKTLLAEDVKLARKRLNL